MGLKSEGILSIPRCDLADHYLTGNVPVLVTDGIVDWPALRHWTPDKLADLAPGAAVNLKVSLNGSFRYNPDGSPVDPKHQLVFKDVPFHQAVHQVIKSGHSAAKYYISQQGLTQKLSGLLSDLNCWWPNETTRTNLWLGSSGVTSPLHFDQSANLFGQIYGIKMFTLFAPAETPNLYPYPLNSVMPHLSRVDVSNPDLATYPRYSLDRAVIFSIVPGQMLFLPPFWWHYVESLSVSISVNQWRAPMLNQCSGAMALRSLRTQYKQDRWRRYRKGAKLSSRDLIVGAAAILNENPGVALLAMAAAFDDTELEGDVPDRLLLDPKVRHRLNSLTASLTSAEHEGPLPPSEELRSLVQTLLHSQAL